MKLEPRKYQVEARDAIIKEWDKGNDKTLLVLPTGCHALGEKLLMHNGTTKKVEDIQVGDLLTGFDDSPRRVLRKYTGAGEMYTICSSKGKSFTVTGNHLLTLLKSDSKTANKNFAENIVDIAVDAFLELPFKEQQSYRLIKVRKKSDKEYFFELLEFKIRPAKKMFAKYVGFTVDEDNRYLTDDRILTHNCGKTIVFTDLLQTVLKTGQRALVLAHTGELLEQAIDKIENFSDLATSLEKASSTAIGSGKPIVVGSIQTMCRDNRLEQYPEDFFQYIIVDEAHHSMSPSCQKILGHFKNAKVLGVTATPNRGDQKKLEDYFQSKAYEYEFRQAIKDKFLCPIKVETVSAEIDICDVKMQNGDFAARDIGETLEGYLTNIAKVIKQRCSERKTVVFLPLVSTSQKFCKILNEMGVPSTEVNGKTSNREEVLQDFKDGKYKVICNAMLLTEGWDCPEVDCIVVLRPTRSDSLYRQMCGRGCRLAPGKKDLLLLDFLWLSKRVDLMRPAVLIGTSENIVKRMTAKTIRKADKELDLFALEKEAENDYQTEIEAALMKQLQEASERKIRADRVSAAQSVVREVGNFLDDSNLRNFKHKKTWERQPATPNQKGALKKFGMTKGDLKYITKGAASVLISSFVNRRDKGLCTYKQARLLKSFGIKAGKLSFAEANRKINYELSLR